MIAEIKKIKNALALFGLFAFVFTSIFGFWLMADMGKGEAGSMKACIFTGKTMMCKMDITEHINTWRNLFLAITSKIGNALLILLLLSVTLLIGIAYSRRKLHSLRSAVLGRLYILQHPDIALFDKIKQSFSQGLIQPKIFESAIL